jgi:LPS-assembly protein
MLKLGAWIISPLLFLPLHAQEGQVLPEAAAVSPRVDTITPVPPPEIPFGSAATLIPAMPKSLAISNYGGGAIEGIKDVGVRYQGPGIKVTGDNGLEIYADSAVVDMKAESVTLEGHVSVYQGNILQRGERTVYYYQRKFLDASGLRVSLDPILLEAGKFTVEDRGGKNVYVGEDAGITTHDVEDPNFWVRAKKTTIYPGEKIVFNDLRLYVGEVPVFWLPYLSQPLDAELGYHFIPGSRSNWGPYLLSTYGIMLGGKTNPVSGENEDAWLLSRWHLDLRARRGVGAGIDFFDTRVENKEEISGLSFYYLNDLAPETNTTGVERGFVSPDRYRIELKHRLKLDLPDQADWRIDSNLTLLSDPYYLEDFDPATFRTNPSPDNTLGLYRRDETSLLSLLTRFRINDFYRADTRLPEISFDQAPGPLFGLPILHEGNTSLGYIGEQAADPARDAIINPLLQLTAGDPAAQALLDQLSGYDRQLAERLLALPLKDPKREAIRTQLLDSSYARFNTYQELSMPMTFGGFLNLTPQAGLGYTRYAAANWPIDNLDRTTLHVGAETSVKFSKDLSGYHDSRWGLDGLKHILQPYAAWSVVSTDDFSIENPQVDRLTPSTRPRPLDPVRFTAIDELQSWNVVRMGARNRLLTKRDNQAFEWLYLDSYMDAFIQDPEEQRDYSNFYNDLHWKPLPWMEVVVETQFPIVAGASGFNEFNTLLRFMPTQSFQFSVGYRYLNGHPVLIDSNQVNLETYTRLSENWGIGFHHILEMDDGTLQLQQYTLHRDLGNWVAGLGITRVDNRYQAEYGLVFSLTLKDFPSVSLPFKIDAQ